MAPDGSGRVAPFAGLCGFRVGVNGYFVPDRTPRTPSANLADGTGVYAVSIVSDSGDLVDCQRGSARVHIQRTLAVTAHIFWGHLLPSAAIRRLLPLPPLGGAPPFGSWTHQVRDSALSCFKPQPLSTAYTGGKCRAARGKGGLG